METITYLILLMACIDTKTLAMEGDYEITHIKNPGIVFEKIDMAQFYERLLRIYTSLHIPAAYGDKIKELEQYLVEFEKRCVTKLYDGLECDVRKRQERRQLMEIKAKNKELTQLISHQSWRRRGVINGLGTVLKIISGTMDAEDAEQINNKLNSHWTG